MSKTDAKSYRLLTSEGVVVADQVRMADNLGTRFWGLLGKKQLADGQGMCIQPCNQVHMFFMRMALDIVFVDRDGVVLHLLPNLKPWRMSKMVWGAAAAIELKPGTIEKGQIQKGSQLVLE